MTQVSSTGLQKTPIKVGQRLGWVGVSLTIACLVAALGIFGCRNLLNVTFR